MNVPRPINIFLFMLVALGCGGEPQSERTASSEDDPYAGEPRLGRMYTTEIEKDQPPAIRLSIQLRRRGIARLIFQHGNARAFREERGRWHREDDHLIVQLDPSSGVLDDKSLPVGGASFQEAQLPPRLVFDIGPDELAIQIPSLSERFLRFERSRRDRG